MRFLSPSRVIVTASLVCALAPAPAFSAPTKRELRTALVALYPLTRVGMTAWSISITPASPSRDRSCRSATRHLRRRCQHQERHS